MLKFADDLKDDAQQASSLSPAALDQLFRKARTHNAFLDKPVPEALLKEAVEIAEWGPTSANTLPMRIVFVRSKEAKEKLKPALMGANVDKTMAAPVTAIVGYDTKFFEHAPRLMPHMDIRPWFSGNEAFAERTAFQNGTLQAAYLILALRAVGLDTGPMTGFDNAAVDAAFFAGTTFKSNILINIGYGDTEKLFPRNPRFAFAEIASIV
jgi:3-hydroxypropanoate dehydrogenase